MSDTRQRHLGQLYEKEQRAQVLALKIRDLRERLNHLTDPHRSADKVETSRMRMLIDDWQAAETEFDQLIREAAALRDELGMPRYDIR